MLMTRELADDTVEALRLRLYRAADSGKQVEIQISGGLFEWEAGGYKRRILDGSIIQTISIPADATFDIPDAEAARATMEIK